MFDFKPYLETLSKPNKPENGVGDNYISTLVKVKHGKKEEGQSETLAALRKYAANHVLLLGNPGSGKSTALKQLLQEEAVKCLNNNKRQPIPVFIKLSQLGTKDSFRGELTFPNLIIKELKSSGITTTEQVGQLLLEGDLLLLLDGLNEVITDEYKTQIEQIEKDFSKTQMIFSSRLLGTETYFIEDSLHIQPLTEKQAKDFAYKELGHDTANKMLRNPQWRSRELFYNPLFLWMLCETSQSKSPPENQGDLFRQFTQEEYKKYKKAIVSKNASFYDEVMQELAFLMIQAGGNEKNLWLQISRNQAEKQLKRYFKKEGESDPLSKAKIWLNKALEQHLLQCASEESSIEFPHQLFQEYYAAEWLRSCLDELSDEQLCTNYLNPIKWTESILMVMDLISNKSQAERIINQALSVDLTLAAKLSGRAREEWQHEMLEIVCTHLENLKVDDYISVNIIKSNNTKHVIKYIIKFLNDNKMISAYDITEFELAELTRLVFKFDSKDSLNYACTLITKNDPHIISISIFDDQLSVSDSNSQKLRFSDEKVKKLLIKYTHKYKKQNTTIIENLTFGNPPYIKWEAMLFLWRKKEYTLFISNLNFFQNHLPENDHDYADIFHFSGCESVSYLIKIIDIPNKTFNSQHQELRVYSNFSTLRQVALKTLTKFAYSKTILDKITNLLQDRDYSISCSAAEILSQLSNNLSKDNVFNELMQVVKNAIKLNNYNDKKANLSNQIFNAERLFEYSTYSLTRLDSAKAGNELLSFLDQLDSLQKPICINALSILKYEKSIPKLIELVNEGNFYIKKSSIHALGRIGSGNEVDFLCEQLKKLDTSIKRDTVESLYTLFAKNPSNESNKKIIISILQELQFSLKPQPLFTRDNIDSSDSNNSYLKLIINTLVRITNQCISCNDCSIIVEKIIEFSSEPLDKKEFYYLLDALAKIPHYHAINAWIDLTNSNDDHIDKWKDSINFHPSSYKYPLDTECGFDSKEDKEKFSVAIERLEKFHSKHREFYRAELAKPNEWSNYYCQESNINKIFQEIEQKENNLNYKESIIGRIFDDCPDSWSKLITWASEKSPEHVEPLNTLYQARNCNSSFFETFYSILLSKDFLWLDILIKQLKFFPEFLPKIKDLSLSIPKSHNIDFLRMLHDSQSHHKYYSYEWFEKSKPIKDVGQTNKDFEFHSVIKKIHSILGKYENLPNTYEGMGENGVRDSLLAALQSHYSDVATVTAETLNRNGKADILITTIKGKEEFITECKIWSGDVMLHQTIDQLLGYLTWKDRKAAILFFVPNKDIVSVISNSKQPIKEHSKFVEYHEGFEHSSHGYHCLFRSTAAENSDINLAILFYHFSKIQKKNKDKEQGHDTITP